MSVFIFDENDNARQCGSYYPEIVDQEKEKIRRGEEEEEEMERERAIVK
jgi:hypothetical protein